MGVTDFDTKAAVIVRDDLAVWQRLNVTAFLMAGVTAQAGAEAIGEDYIDADGRHYLPLLVQPVLVFEAPAGKLRTARERAERRGTPVALYTQEMFSTGADRRIVRRSVRSPLRTSTSSASPCARRTATPTPSCAASSATPERRRRAAQRSELDCRAPAFMSAPPSGSPSRFVRLARLCNRHRWRTFGAWLLALVAIQAIAASVGVKEISSFRLPGHREPARLRPAGRALPGGQGRHRPARLQGPHRHAARRRDAGAHRGARSSRSRAGRQRGQRRRARSAPGGRLTKDGRIGVATLNYKESTNDIKPADLENDRERRLHGARPGAAGRARRPGRGGRALQQQPGSVGGVGIFAAAIVLLITFGSLVAAGLPLVATLLALGCALGVITLISHVVDTPDFATQLASLIGLGVGIDYALFVVTRFRAEVRAGRDRDAAIEKAIDTAGRTVMFAAITVVIALLGLLLLGLSFMQGVALGAATAVLADDVRRADDHPGADRRRRAASSTASCASSTAAAASASGARSAASTIPGRAWRARARREARAPARRGRRLGALVARRAAPSVAGRGRRARRADRPGAARR